VGNGTDFTAQVSSGLIDNAWGDLEDVTGVTSISGGSVFSLQLNSNFFTSPTCNGAANPAACQGWQQFILANNSQTGTAMVFMQYWLLNYATTCPGGWNPFGSDCFVNSGAVSLPGPIQANSAALLGLRLSGTTIPGGMDMVSLASNRQAYSVQNADSVLSLSQGWTTAEFNVFGDGGASQAVFNPGSTLLVSTAVRNGNIRAAAPTCIVTGTTGETNNLTLVSPCCSIGGRVQSIKFTESNTSAAPAPCP